MIKTGQTISIDGYDWKIMDEVKGGFSVRGCEGQGWKEISYQDAVIHKGQKIMQRQFDRMDSKDFEE